MNLTFILPTYNRPDDLVNLYKFYKKNKIEKYFMIIDGTKKKNNFLKTKKNYYHKPELDRRKRIEFGLKKVKTKFVCLAADDDLYMPKTILLILKNMNKNRCDVGRGITYNFYTNNKKISFKRKPSTPQDFKSGAFKNLETFINQKNIFFTYCIFKTNFLKKIFKKLKKLSFIEFEINHELFITLYSLILGNVSYTDKVYNMRQQSNTKAGLAILYNYPLWFRIKNFFKILSMILKDYPSTQKLGFFSILKICNLKFDFFPRKSIFKKMLHLILKKSQYKTKKLKPLIEFKIVKKYYKLNN